MLRIARDRGCQTARDADRRRGADVSVGRIRPDAVVAGGSRVRGACRGPWPSFHLGLRPPHLQPARAAGRGDPRGMDDSLRAGRVDEQGRAGPTRHVRVVPEPGAAREDGDDGGRGQRAPPDPRRRGRLVRRGVRGIRLPDRRSRRPVGGGAPHHRPAPTWRARDLLRPLPPGPRCRPSATAQTADSDPSCGQPPADAPADRALRRRLEHGLVRPSRRRGPPPTGSASTTSSSGSSR
jgi:hypothetical protein